VCEGAETEAISLHEKSRSLVLHQEEFCEDKFKQALMMFQGQNYLKNFVKVDNREPDPLGYQRIIKEIKYHEIVDGELGLMYPWINGYKKTIMVEINARSFMWG